MNSKEIETLVFKLWTFYPYPPKDWQGRRKAYGECCAQLFAYSAASEVFEAAKEAMLESTDFMPAPSAIKKHMRSHLEYDNSTEAYVASLKAQRAEVAHWDGQMLKILNVDSREDVLRALDKKIALESMKVQSPDVSQEERKAVAMKIKQFLEQMEA